MENKIYEVVPAQSSIKWVGKKVTGSHDGIIDVTAGEIILKNGKLSGGNFIVDTRSIKVLDIADPALNAQMSGHLASDDFFSSEKFPEANLEIISVNGNYVDANLTIKGITHLVRFEVLMQINDTQLTASAKLLVDRTKYEMKFRSGNFFENLGDTLIYNDFELAITITGQAVKKSIPVLA